MAEDLEGSQAVSNGEVDQFTADVVALGGQTGSPERLHEQSVQSEGQEPWIVESATDLYCGTGTFETVMTGQSARFECDCRQQSRPSGFVAGRKSIESALSGLDDLRSLPRIVGSRPDPGHVVIADDPRGEFDVVQLFSGADDCQSLVSGSLESASARNCQTSEEADG